MTESGNPFAERLRERLLTRGLSQAAVAQSMGVSKNSVNNWAQGRSLPNALHTVAIAELLDVTAEELVSGSVASRPAVGQRLADRLSHPAMADVLVGLAEVAPELQNIVREAERLSKSPAQGE